MTTKRGHRITSPAAAHMVSKTRLIREQRFLATSRPRSRSDLSLFRYEQCRRLPRLRHPHHHPSCVDIAAMKSFVDIRGMPRERIRLSNGTCLDNKDADELE